MLYVNKLSFESLTGHCPCIKMMLEGKVEHHSLKSKATD